MGNILITANRDIRVRALSSQEQMSSMKCTNGLVDFIDRVSCLISLQLLGQIRSSNRVLAIQCMNDFEQQCTDSFLFAFPRRTIFFGDEFLKSDSEGMLPRKSLQERQEGRLNFVMVPSLASQVGDNW